MRDVEAYRDKKSGNYDETFGTLCFRVYDAVTWKYLEPYVPTGPNAWVLDAGGGPGRWAIHMAEKGCKVALIDASTGMLLVAGERIKKQGLQEKVSVKMGAITKTGYTNETFDKVLCEHTNA